MNAKIDKFYDILIQMHMIFMFYGQSIVELDITFKLETLVLCIQLIFKIKKNFGVTTLLP